MEAQHIFLFFVMCSLNFGSCPIGPTQNIKTFDEARDIYFLPDNSAGLKWHNKLVEKYNKKHITPYLDPKVKDYFYQFSNK